MNNMLELVTSNQLKIDLKRIQKRCNINKHIEEFDNVLLKDRQNTYRHF